MLTLEDVAALASGLPAVAEGERHGNRTWSVHGRTFAWERPFSKADVRRFGDEAPPSGPIVAIGVGDLGEKEAIIAADPSTFFTIPHLNGYPAVLVHLENATRTAVRAALLDGWSACAPAELAAEHFPDGV